MIERSRILIVDDESTNVEMLERILGRDGYDNVETTTDPREGLRLWETFKPDLLLLDLMMPDIDGFEVLTRLNRSALGPNREFVPVLVLTADVTRAARNRALAAGASDFVTKPFDHSEVRLRIRNLLVTRHLHADLAEANRDLEVKVRQRTVELQFSLEQLEVMHEDLRFSRRETIRRLSMAAELRDDDTGRHIMRMGRYAGLLGHAAGLDPERATEIELATQMHDVGKIGIPDSVLLKPGMLTSEERAIMERHPVIGYEVLTGSSSELLELAATIALSHHERVDGAGYPRGSMGDEIPFEARIAAIADVFDALMSDRVYRPALSLDETLETMHKGRGSQFDAQLLDVFMSRIPELLAAREAIERSEVAS